MDDELLLYIDLSKEQAAVSIIIVDAIIGIADAELNVSGDEILNASKSKKLLIESMQKLKMASAG